MKIIGRLFGQGPNLPITFVPDDVAHHARFDPEGLMTVVEVRVEDQRERERRERDRGRESRYDVGNGPAERETKLVGGVRFSTGADRRRIEGRVERQPPPWFPRYVGEDRR